MKRFCVIATLLTFLLSSSYGLADTLLLKSGEKITGYFEGGTPRVIKFRLADGQVRDYDILSVENVQFGDGPKTAAAPKPAAPPSAQAPALRSSSERPARPSSAGAADTAYTVPTGSRVTIQLIDSIDSEINKVGETFVAILQEPLIVNRTEVAPKGADVRGRIALVEDANRVKGSAELRLELTQLIVNGIPYAITTSEYNEVAAGRGAQTAKRVGAGAAIGAAIGAIAGGKKGAAVGAGVGAGGGAAVQMMTKGEKLKIPAETILEFTLRAPLVIAAR